MSDTPTFDIGRARRLVADLLDHRQAIYWVDFLVSWSIGIAGAILFLNARMPWQDTTPSWPVGLRVAGYFIAVVALYRVSMFIHEIVHFRRGEMTAFTVTWNLLAGVIMLTPSYFYQAHNDHHNTHRYGTGHDGEYLPLGNGTFGNILLFMAQVLLQPILVVARFLLAPLTFITPGVRQWTLERASSFVINLRHRRTIPADAPRTAWAWLEMACCLRAWLIFIALFTPLSDLWRLPQLYLIAVSILTLNYLRTLAAHRYEGTGDSMSHEEQLFDSNDITGWPLVTEMLCPLGTRYHAQHHLFPRMPYHSAGKAHRRIVADLPPDADYHKIVYASWFAVIRELFSKVRRRDGSGAKRWFASRDANFAAARDAKHTE
jgi:fatty acid desaturase